MSSTLCFEPLKSAEFTFEGLVGRRLEANRDHWLLVAPWSNPAMLEMFRDRERGPRRDLVPWAGEFAGKYLTSGVLCWRIGGDAALCNQLADFVQELISVQGDDGYLGPFPRRERLVGKTADGSHFLWDLWGHYHCLLGLFLWYRETGDEKALSACCRAADYICHYFFDGEARVIDAGAPEMNMAISHILALLYQETDKPLYLRMLKEIEADWQKPGAGDYLREALAGTPFHRMPRPRWESLHDVQAILGLYEITGEERYRQAFEHIWHSIAEADIHNTGGFSSAEKATGNPFAEGAIETCCTVAWMALCVDMLRLTGDPRVADALELATFNAALGAQSPSGRWWTYNTPMDGVRKASAHDIVFQARAGTPELNCCAVNGPRSLGMLSQWSIMRSEDGGIVLNYYGPSICDVALSDANTVRLHEETDYPRTGRVRITMLVVEPVQFALSLRIPAWSEGTRVELNGKAVDGVKAGEYLVLDRTWYPLDIITLQMDMGLRSLAGQREAKGKVSLYRGPLLLAYDRRFNTSAIKEIKLSDVEALEADLVPWTGSEPAPWLLLELQDAEGDEFTLCDFATAGMAGTPYVTWLPVS